MSRGRPFGVLILPTGQNSRRGILAGAGRSATIAPLTLEVIVTSVQDAIEAARGGAHRLEVVRDLHRDGLTPPIALVQQIRREVALPLRVMVRENDGFVCASDDERRTLVDAAIAFNALGVDGIVVGWTRGDAID